MKGKCLWCHKEFEEGEGYSWPDYCTRECYNNWVSATAHVRGEMKKTIEASQDEYARHCGYKDFEELREKDEEALRVWYLKMLEPNPHVGEAKVAGDVGLLRLTFEQGHKLRYLVEQDLIRVRGNIATIKMGIKTGHPSRTKAELNVSLKHYEYELGRLEPLEKEIKDFLAILQEESKQEQHIR